MPAPRSSHPAPTPRPYPRRAADFNFSRAHQIFAVARRCLQYVGTSTLSGNVCELLRAIWDELRYGKVVQNPNTLPELKPTLVELLVLVPHALDAISRQASGTTTTPTRLLRLAYQEQRSRSSGSGPRPGRGAPAADWVCRVGMADPVDALVLMKLLARLSPELKRARVIAMIARRSIDLDPAADAPRPGKGKGRINLEREIENWRSKPPAAMKRDLENRLNILGADILSAKDELRSIAAKLWPAENLT